jgi:hypothetical protein
MSESSRDPAAAGPMARLRGWCALACRGTVVRRGLKFALVVGIVLIGINHGDAILSGSLSRGSFLKMGLTFMVPYVVSVFSSVSAIADNERDCP